MKIDWTRGFTRYHTASGFTLIELLIVIAIVGIMAAGVLVAIDPVDKINSANDAKVQNDVSAIGRASEAYATMHGGLYPNSSQGLVDLVDAGELKRVPVPPSAAYGSAYTYHVSTGNRDCDGRSIPSGESCGLLIVLSPLLSKKYTASATTPFWRYESWTGKSCVAANNSFFDAFCP